MGSRKPISTPNTENSYKRWCSLCHALIIHEDGSLVQGNSLQEHECFRDAEAVRISDRLVYKASPANDVTVQHPVLQDMPTTNLSIQKNLAHVNLVPLSAKKLQDSFGNKFQNSPSSTFITQDASNNNGEYHLSNITRLQGISDTSLQYTSPSSINSFASGGTVSGTADSFPASNSQVALNSNSGQIFPNIVSFQSKQDEGSQYPLITFSNTHSTLKKSAESIRQTDRQMSQSPLPDVACVEKNDAQLFDAEEGCCENASSDEDDSSTQRNFKWTDPMIKLLLDSFNKYRKRYPVKQQLYRKILKDMNNYNYHNVTAKRIEYKIKGLEKSYKDKIDNRGPTHSGDSRLNIPFEDEVLEAFGKKPAIHPTHLVGATYEYSRKDNSVHVEDVDGDEKAFGEEPLEKKKKCTKSSKDNCDEESHEQKKNASCKKQRKYVMNLTPSENSVKQKFHEEILKRKDLYIELKSKELSLKEETRRKDLAIKEESKKQFFEIQKMKLALEAKRLKAQYPDMEFDLNQ